MSRRPGRTSRRPVGASTGRIPLNYVLTAGTGVFTLTGVDVTLTLFQAPLSILGGSASVLQWVRSDLGITAGTAPTFTAPKDFSNAAWTTTALTEATGISDPDGGTAAQRLTETVATSVHTEDQTPANVGTGSTVTLTVAFKTGTLASPRNFGYIEGNGGTMRVVYNTNTGAITSQTGNVSASITSLGSGWYDCSVTYVRTSGVARFGLSSDGATFSYLGTVASDLLIYNARVTELETRVTTWADQSGNGNNYSQSTAANQPLLLTTDGPGSTAAIAFDGTDDSLQSTLDLPAPGTTVSWIWAVFRQRTWTSNDHCFSAGASTFILRQTNGGASPQMNAFNNAANGPTNSGAPVNGYSRMELYFSNTTADYLKLRATSVTGTNCGNNNPAANIRLASASGPSNWADIEIVEWLIVNRLPSGTEKTNLDTYVTNRYGAGLT